MADRVYLHVGVPKTGTTFVQDVLWRGRHQFARHGVCYPLRRRTEHFAATMDLRGATWAGKPSSTWEGAWDRLADRVRTSGAHTAILSGELLAAADPAAVERAVRSFPDHEVHVVVTARDLARQLISGWQEQVKHRVAVRLDEFVAGCLHVVGHDTGPTGDRARRLGRRFWSLHDLPQVTRRWGDPLPAGRLHLVTLPPAGGPRGLLWERLAGVMGLDAALGVGDLARPNPSLGAAEAELLRRYNASRASDLSPSQYDQVARVLLAEKVLAGSPGPALVLPARFADPVHQLCGTVVDELAGRGYDVVGDLTELVPDVGELRAAPEVPVGPELLADALVRAVAGLVAELGPWQRRLKARRSAREDRESPARTSPLGRRRPRPPTGAAPHAGPIYLHVGAPKTGTTFLQDVLWHHRESLATAGVLFARRRYGDHYHASLNLRGVPDPAPTPTGTWDHVVQQVRDWPGTSVVSHELFAAARPDAVERAMESLGADRVHVVYTVRDLWHLLGAEWQESTKHGRSLSFAAYLHDVLERGTDGVVGRWFWSVHDPVDVLARWSAWLPPERVHVVTVPPRGADPTLLWQRFAGLVGLEPARWDTSVARTNTSLGAAEVTFLRLVNERIGAGTRGMAGSRDYSRFATGLLAQDILAGRSGKARYAPPPALFEEVRARSERFAAGLHDAGYAVVGDLDEIVPTGPGAPTRDPDTTTDEEILDIGHDALAELLQRATAMRAADGPAGAASGGRRSGSLLRRLAGRAGVAVSRRASRTRPRRTREEHPA